jgi:hypothetical protein
MRHSVLRGKESNQRPPGYEPGELPLLYPAEPLLGVEPRNHDLRRVGPDAIRTEASTSMFSAVLVSRPSSRAAAASPGGFEPPCPD